MSYLLSPLTRQLRRSAQWLRRCLLKGTRPRNHSLLGGMFSDLPRSRVELLAENALLRQQLIILSRQVKRPACTKTDRMFLVLLARATKGWKQALLMVQPDTLLGWHRQLFRWHWQRRSKPASRTSKIPAETIELIKTMALNNYLWGAERIRGELLKLGIHVSKRTIQKYMCHRCTRPSSQKWSTFLHNHASEIWACDFLPVTDLLFRSLFAFFIIELKSRKVLHVGVTRHPTDAWIAQQLREATPFGKAPRFLICDHDSKFGSLFARVASSTGIKLLRTPIRAPRANAYCERFLGSVRRECLDHLLILREQQLFRVLQAYVIYFNQARPHQGLQQQIPDPPSLFLPGDARDGRVHAVPVLGGLHHDYRRAA